MATFTKEEIENIKNLSDNLVPIISLKAKDKTVFIRIKKEASILFSKNDDTLLTNIIGRQLLINQKFEDTILYYIGTDRHHVRKLIKESEYFKKFGELQLLDQLCFAIPLIILSFEYYKLDQLENAKFIYLLTFLKPYASRISQHFKFGVNEAQMQYTVENLSEKSDIKKLGSVLDVLLKKSENSFYNYIGNITDKEKTLSDRELHIIYTSGVSSRINSFLAGIYDEYKKNTGKGLDFESSASEVYDKDSDSTEFQDADIVSDASIKANIVSSAMSKITSDGINTRLCAIAAQAYFKSSFRLYVDILKNALSEILDKMFDKLPEFFSAIIGSFLFNINKSTGKKYTMADFKTPVFIRASMEIFSYSHLKDENMLKVKEILKEMLEEHSTEYINFGTTGQRNLRNAMYFYWILLLKSV